MHLTLIVAALSLLQPVFDGALPGGRHASVYANGIAEIQQFGQRAPTYRVVPFDMRDPHVDPRRLAAFLAMPPPQMFRSGEVVVVYRAGVTAMQDLMTASGPKNTPQYTNDVALNATLVKLGVDRSERLFRAINRSVLASARSGAQAASGHAILDISNAYVLHITRASVRDAVRSLLASPAIAYASPNWRVDTLHTEPVGLTASALARARRIPADAQPFAPTVNNTLPGNYDLVHSAQSLLNAPGVDAVAAYDEIRRAFHQLPGQGELITNVSIGDLDDQLAYSNANDPCHDWAVAFGPTSKIIGTQRYLNMPSMPLIPAFVAGRDGSLSANAEVCGTGDPFLDEIGLDFSMMAPLPHDLQRPGDQGGFFSDLLGIAPGASYRLVVPANANVAVSDIDGAFLGAVVPSPLNPQRPDVITASLGFGLDRFGFPGRYLEDDPLTQAVIASIVHQYGVVVCISAGDGLRLFTNAAVGPSGGSAPTDVVAPNGTPTDLTDVALSTAPSLDFDSGAIDVGGTTLDDIFAAPPQDPRNARFASQHAFAETRWTGFAQFSSGFGTRVNVSAPSDNVLAFFHVGYPEDSGAIGISGGTSASAPEVAAAAAIALQVARLTGHPFQTALDVRSFLERTGAPVPRLAQADRNINVGPQVDITAAVETLLAQSGRVIAPGAPRVAIEQRQSQQFQPFNIDEVFLSDTHRDNISIFCDWQLQWITIAPDWEGVRGARFRLFPANRPQATLATTRWARLLPASILTAAGFDPRPTVGRKVSLVYEALRGARVLAVAPVTLKFLPAGPCSAGGGGPLGQDGGGGGGTIPAALAPDAPPLVSGTTLHVNYDLSASEAIGIVDRPHLIVDGPARTNPATGPNAHTAFSQLLTSVQGSVDVPVSALRGAGIYGVAIEYKNPNDVFPVDSDFAFVRVAAGSNAHSDAPLVQSARGAPGAHFVEIPYGGSFTVNWNVANVPGATGALLEISAGGPTLTNLYATFNNPGGTLADANGSDFGSVYKVAVAGARGSVTLSGLGARLIPSFTHNVRVIPMAGGTPVGEASDVSSVEMDGVVAPNGGTLAFGYGISRTGSGGVLTSDRQTSGGGVIASVDAFDQRSNVVGAQIAGSGNPDAFVTVGDAMMGDDTALFGMVDPVTKVETFSVASPASGGAVTGPWTPPVSGTRRILAAAVGDGPRAAFLTFDPQADPTHAYGVFASDVAHNTFSPSFDVSAALPPHTDSIWEITGFALDGRRNQAILIAAQYGTQLGAPFPFCLVPRAVTVNLTTGVVTSHPTTGEATYYGAAVDPLTGKVAFPGNRCLIAGLVTYDLNANGSVLHEFQGFPMFYTAVDQRRGSFFMEELFGFDFLDNANNNALSIVKELDEFGNVRASIERFNFLNQLQFSIPDFPLSDFSASAVGYAPLQVNPSLGVGYVPDATLTQLEPFSY